MSLWEPKPGTGNSYSTSLGVCGYACMHVCVYICTHTYIYILKISNHVQWNKALNPTPGTDPAAQIPPIFTQRQQGCGCWGLVAAPAAPLSAQQLRIPGGLTFEIGAAGKIEGVLGEKEAANYSEPSSRWNHSRNNLRCSITVHMSPRSPKAILH